MRELQAHKKWAEIWEAKDIDQDNENSIRIYCTQAPDVFGFQIRTFKPIVESIGRAKGKPRNMIAHVSLSITELEEILAYCRSQYPKMKRVNEAPLEKF